MQWWWIYASKLHSKFLNVCIYATFPMMNECMYWGCILVSLNILLKGLNWYKLNVCMEMLNWCLQHPRNHGIIHTCWKYFYMHENIHLCIMIYTLNMYSIEAQSHIIPWHLACLNTMHVVHWVMHECLSTKLIAC